MDREPIDFGFVLNEEKPEFLYPNEPVVYHACRDIKKQIPSIELAVVKKLIDLITASNRESSVLESHCREIADTLQCLLEACGERKLDELLCSDSTLIKCECCGVISQRKRTYCSAKPANLQSQNVTVADVPKFAKTNGGNFLRMYQERKKYKLDARCNEEAKNKVRKSVIDPYDTKNNPVTNENCPDYHDKCLDPENVDRKNEVRRNENMEAERDEVLKEPMNYESRIFVNLSIDKHDYGVQSHSNGDAKVLGLSIDKRPFSAKQVSDHVSNISESKNKSRDTVESPVNDKQRAKIQGQQHSNVEHSSAAQKDHQNHFVSKITDTVDAKKQTSKRTQCLEPNTPFHIVTGITGHRDKKKQPSFPYEHASIVDTMKYLARGHSWDTKKENIPQLDQLTYIKPRYNGKKESFVLHGSRDEHPQLDGGFWLCNKPKQSSQALRQTNDSTGSEKLVGDLDLEPKREASLSTQSAENDSLEDCSLNPLPMRPGESETTTAFSSSSAENMIREWVKPVRDEMGRISRMDGNNGTGRIGRIDEGDGVGRIDGVNEGNGINGSNNLGETKGVCASDKIDKIDGIDGIEQRRGETTSEARDRGKWKPDAMFVRRIRDQIAEAIDRYVNYSEPSSNKVGEPKDGYIDPRETTPFTEEKKALAGQIELSKSRANEFTGCERLTDGTRHLRSRIDSSDIKQSAELNTAKQLIDSIQRNKSVTRISSIDINEPLALFLPKQKYTIVSVPVANTDAVRVRDEKVSAQNVMSQKCDFRRSSSDDNSEHFERQIIYDSSSLKDVANESECSASEVLPLYQKILESSEQMDWESFQQLVETLHPGQKELWSDICRAISNEAKRVAGESGCTTEVCIEINPISPAEREGKVKARDGEITFEMDMTLKDVRNFLNEKFGKLEKTKRPGSVRNQGR